MATTHVELDRQRIKELTEREEKRLNERTQASQKMYDRARNVLTGGVASSYQLREPWPIYLEHGDGPRVWDVDGNEMYDFHNGFGSMVQGHAHPAIGKAIGERYVRGTHFAAPTEDAIVVGEELARRWDIHRWRYTNSGSESTMDAIRIARAYTKRHTVMKIFGSYHGHHDTVMVSIGVEYDKIGPHEAPASLPYGAGIPQSVVDEVFSVHFNDAESLDRRIAELDREGRKPACMIMEPAMMNLGVVLPEPGYLEAVREITSRHGVVLIFDEVKTGLCIAAGRRRRALRRHARHGHAGQGAGRRHARRRHRRQRGGHVGRRGRLGLPGRHLQRQPARHGGRPREPDRGAHARGLPAPGRAERADPARLHRGHRALRPVGLLGRRRAPRAA